MAGRREKYGQSIRGSRIAGAIAIGVLLGCVFAFLYPNGFFSPDPRSQSHPVSKSNLQVSFQLIWVTYIMGL